MLEAICSLIQRGAIAFIGSFWGVLVGGSLLVIAIVSLYPAHDDWCIEPSRLCSPSEARVCVSKWSNCMGSNIVVDPSNPGNIRQEPARLAACINDYHEACRSCGEPRNNGTYLERLKRYGPWYLGGGEAPYCPLEETAVI